MDKHCFSPQSSCLESPGWQSHLVPVLSLYTYKLAKGRQSYKWIPKQYDRESRIARWLVDLQPVEWPSYSAPAGEPENSSPSVTDAGTRCRWRGELPAAVWSRRTGACTRQLLARRSALGNATGGAPPSRQCCLPARKSERGRIVIERQRETRWWTALGTFYHWR